MEVTNIRNTWNWTKIKADPKNPFFAQRSTKNTPQTAVILLRNADVPILQITPPVFMPSTAEQVQHSLNVLLFMSDFNAEPRPLALSVLSCSSTGQIHFICIANQDFTLILPTYQLTRGGRQPELLPPLLKTFLESKAYSKVGFGMYEDAVRIEDQYGIQCKNILDIHWMAKIMGVGSTSVGTLHEAFGAAHDGYTPGFSDSQCGSLPRSNQQQPAMRNAHPQVIDPRRWDWESQGNLDLSRELVRCISQDARSTLQIYGNIQEKKFNLGYTPMTMDFESMSNPAREFLSTNIPRGILLPLRSMHRLLSASFLDSSMDPVSKDAHSIALVKYMIEHSRLVPDPVDTTPVSFQEPSVLSRCFALPGVRASEGLLSSQHSRKILAEAFGCRVDELRLLKDSDRSRKPDRIQDLECFIGIYEWLEFLPGAEKDALGSCPGRGESTVTTLMMNFGTVAEKAKAQPAEIKHWLSERLIKIPAMSSANFDEAAQRELSKFLEAEQAKARLQQSIHTFCDLAFDKCVTKIGNKLDRSEEACLANTVDRFLDTSLFIVRRLEETKGSM
ncbi:Mitochondrial import inner membrane translocase subunit tim8 [Lunasporangiospora selenospora]|uniref:Mitochondrial import inner membrane translocase subunit tim8 n=1 Tax=Lunasporangiospora selenospora TaxID=979761 RepID=A0A9P6FYW7_9FUNG|nr:Mitochondrial import inner membrane translocase subunit tim8 [Lunasporangiospora selenospora]